MATSERDNPANNMSHTLVSLVSLYPSSDLCSLIQQTACHNQLCPSGSLTSIAFTLLIQQMNCRHLFCHNRLRHSDSCRSGGFPTYISRQGIRIARQGKTSHKCFCITFVLIEKVSSDQYMMHHIGNGLKLQ